MPPCPLCPSPSTWARTWRCPRVSHTGLPCRQCRKRHRSACPVQPQQSPISDVFYYFRRQKFAYYIDLVKFRELIDERTHFLTPRSWASRYFGLHAPRRRWVTTVWVSNDDLTSLLLYSHILSSLAIIVADPRIAQIDRTWARLLKATDRPTRSLNCLQVGQFVMFKWLWWSHWELLAFIENREAT